MSIGIHDASLTPVGYEQKTAFNGAAEKIKLFADYVLLTADVGTTLWRDDGVDPTSSIGSRLPAGSDFWYTGDVSKLRVIGFDAAAILSISGYKT